MRATLLTILLAVVAGTARAQLSNVVLQAPISGVLGVQDIGQNSQVVLSQAAFNSDTLLTIIGISPQPNHVIALNFDLLNGRTNLSLLVFDKGFDGPVAGENITTAESTTFISDGQNFMFRLSARVPTRFPEFAGGLLEIAGHGQIRDGLPTRVTASVRGLLVDARPFDTGGSTGVIMRATLKTGATLRRRP